TAWNSKLFSLPILSNVPPHRAISMNEKAFAFSSIFITWVFLSYLCLLKSVSLVKNEDKLRVLNVKQFY
ncbi:hypothetical protein ACQP3C_29205, partial [Escherichia coli]